MSILANMREAVGKALSENADKADLVFKMSPESMKSLVMEFGFVAQFASSKAKQPQYYDDVRIEVVESLDGWHLCNIRRNDGEH